MVSVLLVVVWVGSGWWGFLWMSPRRFGCVVWAGQIKAGHHTLVNPQPEFEFLHPPGETYHLYWSFSGGTSSTVGLAAFPIWSLVLPSLLVTAAARRLDTLARRRARAGLCPKCDYDRTGLTPTALCPECGTPAPAPPPATT